MQKQYVQEIDATNVHPNNEHKNKMRHICNLRKYEPIIQENKIMTKIQESENNTQTDLQYIP